MSPTIRASEFGDPLSVVEVCEGINQALRTHLGAEVWVRGAISGLNRSARGHVYFDLIEPDDVGQQPTAILKVALFANAKFRVNAIMKKSGAIRMEDGIEVSIGGSIEHYAPTGTVQLIMKMIDPSYTLGRLAESKEATLKRLAVEGLLDRNRSLPLPVLPIRVALITSEGSAAEADFMEELTSSSVDFQVHLLDARVQGPDAPSNLAAAITLAGELPVDVVAMVRGGGAKTDLVAFDDYSVAAAVAACPVPVVVGVGHEIDRSICDEVGAVSAKTPTAAAHWIVQRVLGFDLRVQRAGDRLATAAKNQLISSRQRTDSAQRRLAAGAQLGIATAARRQERSISRLQAAATASMVAAGHRLERNELRRTALDPTAVMARGWSITRAADGTVVGSVDQLVSGDTMTTQIADGLISSTVLTTEPSSESATESAPPS